MYLREHENFWRSQFSCARFFFALFLSFPDTNARLSQQINYQLEEVARERAKDETPREEPKATARKGPSPREREQARLRKEEEEEEKQRRAEEEERRAMREKEMREQEEIDRKRREREEEDKRRDEDRRREEEEKRKREEEERERLEIERRAQEERDRLARDAEEQERQRKKQALLAKLSAMDDSDQNGKAKSILTMSPTRTRKEWKFTEPVENMYQGKPAYDITSSPKRKSRVVADDDDDGQSYKPSFGGKWNSGPKSSSKGRSLFDEDDGVTAKNNNNNTEKKGDFMSSLFGGDKGRKPSLDREGSGLDFTTNSNPPPQAARRKSSTRPSYPSSYQPSMRESSPQYGAGLGMVSDSPPPTTNSRLLPRRTNQASSGFNRAPANDIDDLDDIEEVVL